MTRKRDLKKALDAARKDLLRAQEHNRELREQKPSPKYTVTYVHDDGLVLDDTFTFDGVVSLQGDSVSFQVFDPASAGTYYAFETHRFYRKVVKVVRA